jgi:hypothetical protein
MVLSSESLAACFMLVSFLAATQKMQAACPPETLIDFQQPAWRWRRQNSK